MKIKLIANPVAGGDARKKIDRIVSWMQARGVAVETTLTQARGDARKAAAAARFGDFDRVVAAGGDGTLNEVINGLAPSEIPLAFIPLGTTNVFALEVNIPLDLERACALVLDGAPRPISLGQADGQRFLLMAGIGFDAEVVRGVRLSLKRRVGKLAYLVSGLGALCRYRPQPLEVTPEDGVSRLAYGVVICNSRLYGGSFVLSPGASLYNETLSLCLLLSKNRLGFLLSMIKIALGRPLLADEAIQLQTRRVVVTGSNVPVQLDGDYLGELPGEFQATYGELCLVLPPGAGEADQAVGKGGNPMC